MKAVLMTADGSPEVLQVQDVQNSAVPLGETEILVEWRAVVISPIDTYHRAECLLRL